MSELYLVYYTDLDGIHKEQEIYCTRKQLAKHIKAMQKRQYKHIAAYDGYQCVYM